eukprot:Opistho-2@77687
MVSSVLITGDSNGIILSVSSKCSEIFGYTSDEILGHNLSMLMPPPFNKLHDQFIERFKRTGEAHIIGSSRIVEGLHKDGSIVPIRLSVSHVALDNDHLFIGLMEKMDDKTAKIAIDAKGLILSVNNLCSEMFGYTARELVGSNVSVLMPDEIARSHDGYMHRHAETGHSKVLNRMRNLTGKKKDGHLFPITLKAVPTQMPDGTIMYQAEILDMGGDGYTAVFTCDASGTVSAVSANLLPFFGLKAPTEIVGHHFRVLFPDSQSDDRFSTDGRVRALALHSDGSRIEVHVEVNKFSVAGTILWSFQVERISNDGTRFRDPRDKYRDPRADGKENPALASLKGMGQYIGNYRVGKVLGTGSFGAALLATHRLTGKVVAIKAIAREKINANIEREIEILRHVRHSNIARLYEIINTPQRVFLVMEYVSGGELFDYIVNNGACTEREARGYFRDLLSAVDYLHSVGIVHRDLKLENMLLDGHGNIKLIDFGLSNFMNKGKRLDTCCGSPMYAGPEMYRGAQYEGPEVDVWSMGVILFAMLEGTHPFQQPEDVVSGRFTMPTHLSKECQDLISRMLVVDPARRVAVDQIYRHPWVNKDCDALERTFSIDQISLDSFQPDPEIVATMSDAGFSPSVVLASLRSNSFNQVTATYHFLEEKKKLRTLRGGQHKAGGPQTVVHPPSTSPMPQPAQLQAPHLQQLSAKHGTDSPRSMSPNSSTSGSSRISSGHMNDYCCGSCGRVDDRAQLSDLRIVQLIEALLPETAKVVRAQSTAGARKRRASHAANLVEQGFADVFENRAHFEQYLADVIATAKKMNFQ